MGADPESRVSPDRSARAGEGGGRPLRLGAVWGLITPLVCLTLVCLGPSPAAAFPSPPASAFLSPPASALAAPPPLSRSAISPEGAPAANAAGVKTGAEKALYAAPTRLDQIGRVVAPVMINGRGPYLFIVDTGATRSTISPQLATELSLTPAAERSVTVNGITGTGEVPTVPVDSMQAGDLIVRDSDFPVVCAPPMDCADGVLGVAGLHAERLLIDFQHDRVAILRSHRQGAPPGFLTIPATRLEGGLMAIPAKIGGVRVKAIIDTGSERTLGNPALQAALQARRAHDPAPRVTTVYGATTDTSDGLVQNAPPIMFRTATISNTAIVFGDFHIFDVWNLRDEPAIIVGMDVLGTLRALIVDFRDSELYLDSREQAVTGDDKTVSRPERLDPFHALSQR